MKRLLALFMVAAVFLCLCVLAFADNFLEKPLPGQIINIVSDGHEDWQGDFYLSALTGMRREGDDLCLFFPAARVRMMGFFTEDRRRELRLIGGKSVSAADFDEDGIFSGAYSDVEGLSKSTDETKEAAWLNPESVQRLKALIQSSGITVTLGDETLWGEERARVTGFISTLSQGLNPDWTKTDKLTLEFEFLGEDAITLTDITLRSRDGLSLSLSYSETLWPVSAAELIAVSEGRGSIAFSNDSGESLCRMNYVCNKDETGALLLSCPCSKCGENQGGALHYLSCGHYSCLVAEGEEHAIPPCETAGHCKSDGKEHKICSNCRQPVCNGLEHGYGLCIHEHNWMTYARTPASAAADGTISNRCSSCGAEYTQIIPRYGT